MYGRAPPDQWNVGIALIGHEVGFERHNIGGVFGLAHSQPLQSTAKLLLPTPVRTINDIPEELKKNYPDNYLDYWQYKRGLKELKDDADTDFKERSERGNENIWKNKDKISYRFGYIYGAKATENRLVPIIQELKLSAPVEESWDDILDKWLKESRPYAEENELWEWLKQHYSSPKRKA